MATQGVKPDELNWGQIVIVGLTHYTVIGVYKHRKNGLDLRSVRTRDRDGILTTFTYEADERIMAVVPRDELRPLGNHARPSIRNRTNRRY